jgi:hypothetical protein
MLSLLVGGMKFLFPKLFVIKHLYIVTHAEEKYSVIKQGVCQTAALPFILKSIRIMETQIFHHAKI